MQTEKENDTDLNDKQNSENTGNETSNAFYNFLNAFDSEQSIDHELMGFRDLDNEDLYPSTLPTIGNVEEVSIETARKAISENHSYFDYWDTINSDAQLLSEQMLDIVKNRSLSELIGTTTSIELNNFESVVYIIRSNFKKKRSI